MNHAPTAHALKMNPPRHKELGLSLTVKFSYKPLVYFASGFFLSQISQAFRALLKTSKQLITNHLRKAGHSLCPKSTPKHRKKPPKSSPFTRSKHNDYDVKAQLWPCKSYALTSGKAKNDNTNVQKTPFHRYFLL